MRDVVIELGVMLPGKASVEEEAKAALLAVREILGFDPPPLATATVDLTSIAVRRPGRWAAFTDDELHTIDRAFGESGEWTPDDRRAEWTESDRRLVEELLAELERRRA